MRGLVSVLLLAALAVAITLGARYNTGYVLLVLHPYRVEVSLNFLLALLLLAFVAGYVLVRMVARTLRLPIEVRQFRERRRLVRANRSLLAALRAFLEGRYAKAEKAAAQSIEHGEHGGIAAVIAARAAHELRAYDRRDRYLARSSYYADSDQTMRAIAQAELLLQQRQHQEALAALDALPQKHTAALRLELRAVQLARNWDRYLELLGQLDRLHALESTQVQELRRHAIGEIVARKAHDLPELREYWQRLGPRERLDSKIAACAARSFASLGDCGEAHTIIEQSLANEWDGDLVALYAYCVGPDTRRQIEHAESWLSAHPSDATLLLALGRLCARQQLWGKARSYIEASLSLEETFHAHMALARLLDEVGETDAARVHHRRSLELAEAAMRQPVAAALSLKPPRAAALGVQMQA